MNGPELFALAHGQRCEGEHQCYYCGSPCGEHHTVKQWVKPTFNDRASVARPDSQFVCVGCTLAMNEKREMPGKDKPQKTRNYSWVATANAATPYSKANIAELADICLNPPEPPYMIAIATSGQKQIIWRAPANQSRDYVTVQLEDEHVTYATSDLAKRRQLTMRLAAAISKPQLSEPTPWPVSIAMTLHNYYDDGLTLMHTFTAVASEPLSRLAIFLTPGKDTCKDEYPPTQTAGDDRRERVSQATCGPDDGGLFDPADF